MLATFDGLNGRSLRLRMPLRDFLAGRVMRQRAQLNLCTPEELVADHIPPCTDPDEPDEVAQGIAEACEAASGYTVSGVTLEPTDLRFVRRRLHPDRHGLRLLEAGPPPTAA